VVNWIAFDPEDVQRDMRLFAGKTRQYIFISSASVYQKPPLTPFIREDTPLSNPYWDYSRRKIACEEVLMAAFRSCDFPVTIVRPSLTYDTVIPVAIGSWDDFTIIDRMRQGKPVIVHGDGSSLWTVTHAEDFAKGFLGLLGHSQTIGHAFHITSDEVLTWDQIYRMVAAAAGVEAKIVHVPSDFIVKIARQCGWDWMEGNLLGDKAWSLIFDNSKLKRFVPEYCATIRFEEGIRRTIAWFEEDPERQRIVPANNEFIDTVLNAYEQLR
ncbi:MAG: NAD-dependent epimerase/dehydratase family protein, partial [Lentisphaerae bacterium]